MFAVELSLLTGRYTATSFDDRRRAEWPPHPARLFSALAATYFESGERSGAERSALEWLEAQGAPQLVASDASRRDVATVFVPVNDPSVVPSVDDEAADLADALAEIEAATSARAKAAAEKKLGKARQKFEDAVKKAKAPLVAGKEGKEGPRTALSLLPDHRGRQPRTFPSVTPQAPRITFVWPAATADGGVRAAIDAILSRLVRVGHSSSLVTARIVESPTTPTWIPDETGEVRAAEDTMVLRVMNAGQLAALDARGDSAEPGRVMPATFQRYVRPHAESDVPVPTSVFGADWIVLRRTAGPRLPTTRAVDVARAVRSALLSSHGPDAPEMLSGHGSPGQPSKHAHVAIVPLPFVGNEHADGTILGVAVVVPLAATKDERNTVYRAVTNWRRQASVGPDDESRLPVHLGAVGTLEFALLDDIGPQSTLRAKTWCARARSWATATPIALDRNPGDMRSRDPEVESAAYAAAQQTIARACEHIGLPSPSSVTALPAAPLSGAAKARQFPVYAAGKPPVQRVLVHARIEFERPVEGPLLIGAGRYLGLGLLRPVREHA